MTHRRFTVAALGTAVLALVLSGCSLLPQSSSGGGPAPTVGQCWNATLGQANAWADWHGSEAASCSSTHVLYTYGIGKVTGVSASDWTAKGSKTALDDTIAAKADESCDASYAKLLPTLAWSQQLVQAYFFVPTQAEWKAGARWVRCDVGVLATGTSVDKQKLSELPTRISTFTELVTDDPERFDYCVNSPESVKELGPLDSSKSVVADCTQNPQWELTSDADFAETAGAAFPSKSEIKAATAEACSDDVQGNGSGDVWTAYVPSTAQWKTGDREIDCWVGSDSSGGGSPSTA
jgi:hypothetical protein